MIRTAKSLIIAGFVALTASACALTEDVVPVTYTPIKDPAPIGAAGKSFELNVADNRGVYRGQIGAKVNGWGQEMAAIRSTVPVQEVFRMALVEELKARGVSVDSGPVRAIDIGITAMHNNFKVGFASGTARGIAAFTVKVVGADGAVRYDGTISEIFEEDGIQLATGENAALAVSGALNKALKKLFEDQKFISALTAA